jgi:LacI family transcriptional regulator
MSREEKRILLLDSDSRAGWDQVDGVIACRPQDPEGALRLRPAGLPCVSLMASIEGIPSIVADDFGGAKKAVQYLMSLGHKRIACMAEPQFPISRMRVAGYRDALQEGGLTPDPLWVRQPLRSHFEASSNSQGISDRMHTLGGEQAYRQWGYDNMRDWLNDDWAQQKCSAILAQNDLIAIGIIQALQEAGLRVPQDVSIIGFDGTEVCDHCSPRLTSIEIPFHEVGSKGSEVLLQQIEARNAESKGMFESMAVLLPARIRAGESTMPFEGSRN